MTDKDSQLDDIETEAKDAAQYDGYVLSLDPKLFQLDGLYYEMRRQLNALQDRALQYENERLRQENKRLSNALVTFGTHTDGCSTFTYADGSCDCGWTRQQARHTA